MGFGGWVFIKKRGGEIRGGGKIGESERWILDWDWEMVFIEKMRRSANDFPESGMNWLGHQRPSWIKTWPNFKTVIWMVWGIVILIPDSLHQEAFLKWFSERNLRNDVLGSKRWVQFENYVVLDDWNESVHFVFSYRIFLVCSFCIIEGPETVQDFVQMQLQEIQDNIRSRRNKIFLLMEEVNFLEFPNCLPEHGS